MKKNVLLIVCVLLFISCKENVINGFNAKSVKGDIVKALNGSEWEAINPEAFYTRIVFNNGVVGLVKEESTVSVGFDVTNVTGLMENIPSVIQLRLKTASILNELYLSKDYSAMSLLIALDSEVGTNVRDYHYRRIK